MLVKVAALINGHRTVQDIVRKLCESFESEEVYHVLYALSDWNLIVAEDFDPNTVVEWQSNELAKQFRSVCRTCEPCLRALVSINPDDDFPIFSYAAIPKKPDIKSGGKENDLAKQDIYTAGSEFTPQTGILTALGELVETMAITWREDIKITRAKKSELGTKGLHPHQFLLFSERQYQERNVRDNQFGERHRVPYPVRSDNLLDWVEVSSYPEGKPYFVPAGLCYLHCPHDRNYLIADSNGCAAGPTRKEAIVSGFLEVVERDAVGIWWYNRIIRPAIDPEYFRDTELDGCLRWLEILDRRFYALDLTHDLGIPVIAAISMNSDESDIDMGFGANFDYLSALKSAVREMLQVHALKRIIQKQIDVGGLESLDQSARNFILWAQSDFIKNNPQMQPGKMRSPKAVDRFLAQPGNLKEKLHLCTSIGKQKGRPIFVLDYTPPAAGVSVVRVIVPGMRHIKARFAPGRLYQVPVDMGWLSLIFLYYLRISILP